MLGDGDAALDSTIANVALPYMQGSLSATLDEITWVLTSYVIAAAIMTAPVGWLAARFGRKRLFIVCIVGFTVTSMLCGAAQSLEQIVCFRLLQGMFGAALVPLSQATMLDIYPIEQRAQAMAIWGMGVMIGPIMGPTLGGYLTEMYNWRWVFYINLPFGILATLGLMLFMPRRRREPQLRFDWIGFAVLALGIGALADDAGPRPEPGLVHLARDHHRGGAGGLGFYLFVVHMFTAREAVHPAGAVQGPQFRRPPACMMFCVGTDHGGEFRADGAVAAEPGRLSGRHRRPDRWRRAASAPWSPCCSPAASAARIDPAQADGVRI